MRRYDFWGVSWSGPGTCWSKMETHGLSFPNWVTLVGWKLPQRRPDSSCLNGNTVFPHGPLGRLPLNLPKNIQTPHLFERFYQMERGRARDLPPPYLLFQGTNGSELKSMVLFRLRPWRNSGFSAALRGDLVPEPDRTGFIVNNSGPDLDGVDPESGTPEIDLLIREGDAECLRPLLRSWEQIPGSQKGTTSPLVRGSGTRTSECGPRQQEKEKDDNQRESSHHAAFLQEG